MDSEHAHRLLETVRPAAPPEDAGDPQVVLYAAFNAVVHGDFDLFGEFVTDDVELHISGFGPMDGHWRGRAAVVAATKRNFGLVAKQKPEVESMIAQGDCVAVMVRESGVLKSDGRGYSLRGVQWFTFDAGRVKRIEEILASTPAA